MKNRIFIGSNAPQPPLCQSGGVRHTAEVRGRVFPLRKGGQGVVVSAPPLKLRGGWEGLFLAVAVMFFCSFVILSWSKDAFAVQASPTVQLPQTGQTKCYNTSGTAIDCAGTGQDGDKKMGVAWAASDVRFTAGTGAQADCVTDNLTGLMWVKTPDSTTRTWQAAIDYAKGLDLCGFTDWRVPSVIDLESMVNAEQSNSAAWLNTQGFSNVQSFVYWSSTTYADYTSGAWYVGMVSGDVFANVEAYSYYVWPVRGGQ
jgi:hypothetical protein